MISFNTVTVTRVIMTMLPTHGRLTQRLMIKSRVSTAQQLLQATLRQLQRLPLP